MGSSHSRTQAALALALISSPFVAAYIRRTSIRYHSKPPESRYFHHPPLPPPTVPSTATTSSAHLLSTPHLLERVLYHLLPIPWQHYLRDKGALQLSNAFALLFGPLLYLLPHSPRLFYHHALPSNQPLRLRYTPHSHHTVEVHNAHRRKVAVDASLSPCVVFTHGGAWGSGNALMYRLLSTCFDTELRCVTFTHNYSVYPAADATQQVEQLRQLLAWLADEAQRFGGDASRVVLVGHSSGAHISLLHLLSLPPPPPSTASTSVDSALSPFAEDVRRQVRVVGVIGLSGVYHIASHYQYESRRGVHEFSPMKPVCHGPPHFDEHSPTCLAQRSSEEQASGLPPLLLVHGDRDETVPDEQSRGLCEALGGRVRRLGVNVEGREVAAAGERETAAEGSGACECIIYADGDHGSTVLSLMTRTGTHLMHTLRTFIRRCSDGSGDADRRQRDAAALLQLEQLRLMSRL